MIEEYSATHLSVIAVLILCNTMFCIVKISSTTGNFVHKKRHMQTSKFKVLLYLKKSKLYKSKQAPIMK